LSASTARRPNVVLIVTDQQRADHVGFGGHPSVQTPALDALARRGRRFDRCHVANPICMPNRATILTGRMPSVHGTRTNGIPLAWDANTFVRALRAEGYATALVGKAHFQNMGQPGLDDQRLTGPWDADGPRWPEDWDLWEEATRHRAEWVELPEDYYGFDHVELVTGHTDAASGHYVHWLREHGVDPDGVRGPASAPERYEGWSQVYRSCLPPELYHTSYVAERACRQIERFVGESRPFLLQVSFPDPHHPFGPPGEYYDRHHPSSIVLPESWHDDLADAPPHLQAIASSVGVQAFPVQPFRPTEDQYRHAVAAELGMIELIDDAVARVLTTLDAHGLTDETLVVFTSDHGDVMGDHGLLLKGSMHYEGCTRVPLVLAGPGIRPGSTDALASSLDLAPTILEACGITAPPWMQGRALQPLLDVSGPPPRDTVLVEEDQPFDIYGTGHGIRMRTIITADARLTLYEGTEVAELYDLRSDPHEMHNLAAVDAARSLRGEMFERLARAEMEHDDRAPRPLRFTA